MASHIGRRKFLTTFGGAAVAWPLAAPAQPVERARRIGILVLNAEGDPAGQIRVAAFRQVLRQSGWIEGRTLSIDYRWGIGDATRAQTSAADLVALAPDAIVANGTPAARPTSIAFSKATAGAGTDQVRACHQPANGKGSRPRSAAHAARPR